jgi:anti-sigma regulatory factor (Ser/Thr protein kinase)
MLGLRGPCVRWRVPRRTGASGRARKAVRTTLARWGWDEDHVAAVVLVASELLTNAHLHTDGDVRLTLRRTRRGVRLSVTDTDPRMPTRRDTGPQHEGGFGLHILDTITTDWGVRTHRTGKTVWADIDTPRPDANRRPWPKGTRVRVARARAALGSARRRVGTAAARRGIGPGRSMAWVWRRVGAIGSSARAGTPPVARWLRRMPARGFTPDARGRPRRALTRARARWARNRVTPRRAPVRCGRRRAIAGAKWWRRPEGGRGGTRGSPGSTGAGSLGRGGRRLCGG